MMTMMTMMKLVMVLLQSAQYGLLSSALPCRPLNNTTRGRGYQEPKSDCDETTITHDGGTIETGDMPSDTDDFSSHAVYTVMVAAGVILLPLIVFARVCWIRKLQRERNRTINEVRRIVDQRLQDQGRPRGIFIIDLADVPFEEIYGKPPSYEECLASTSTGCPPPYDEPPKYSQTHTGEGSEEREGREITYSQQPTTSNV